MYCLRDWAKMSIQVLDFIEAWWLSIRLILEPIGVRGHFERSPLDRLNPSCHLNLRRNEFEADLLVWASGDAELGVVAADGSVREQHFDDIRKQPELGAILSLVVIAMMESRSEPPTSSR